MTLKSMDAVTTRAASMTDQERRRLAGHWRRQYGGLYASMAAREAAASAQRDGALKLLVAASRAVKELEGESSERESWDAACAAQCVSETILALTVLDLVGTGRLKPRHVATLLRPWRLVIGDDLLPHPVADPAGVRFQGAEDRGTDDEMEHERAQDEPQEGGGDPEDESSGDDIGIHATEGSSREHD